MGISIGAAKLLLAEAARRPFEGRVLTLGRQYIYLTAANLEQIAAEADVPLNRTRPAESSTNPWTTTAMSQISDDYLLSSLGFSETKSMDVSDYENATYIFDLNNPELPESLVGYFDVIIDAGTIEHVFHIPNVMNNMFRMLKTGGRVIHQSPSSNHIDHGFYMFSPTFFWEFYATNEFDINCVQMIRYSPDFNTEAWEISDYTPGCLARVSGGGLDDGMYAIHSVFTKTPQSTGCRIPQQGFYVNMHANAKPSKPDSPEKLQPETQFSHNIQDQTRKRPLAIRLAKKMVPPNVRQFLRSTFNRLTHPQVTPTKKPKKGLQLPVMTCRTKYD